MGIMVPAACSCFLALQGLICSAFSISASDALLSNAIGATLAVYESTSAVNVNEVEKKVH